MRCSIINSTNGRRCANTCRAGLNMCGIHLARSVPHELSFCGEKDTVYRNVDTNGYFSTHHKKVIFDCEREEPSLVLDPAVCQPKKILHKFMGQIVDVHWCDNKNYEATIEYVTKHKDGSTWCHLLYSQDGSTQDVRSSEFEIGVNGLSLNF